MTKRSKQISVVSVGLVAFLILASVASAQNTAKAAPKPLIPLKVDVVFSEYDGAKKVSSLPYTLAFNANAAHNPSQKTSLRMGLRVPILYGQGTSYEDIGTDIDCWADSLDTGLFKVSLSIRHSSLYSSPGVRYRGGLDESGRKPASPNKTSNPAAGNGGISIAARPIFSTFSTSLNLLMRDGQTLQGVMATDPVSGRVLKVDVTLHVVKDR